MRWLLVHVSFRTQWVLSLIRTLFTSVIESLCVSLMLVIWDYHTTVASLHEWFFDLHFIPWTLSLIYSGEMGLIIDIHSKSINRLNAKIIQQWSVITIIFWLLYKKKKKKTTTKKKQQQKKQQKKKTKKKDKKNKQTKKKKRRVDESC